ncbi:MAG: hypothetical protein P1V51_10940 [Deltaproteobacteria bacterium]|nr:hypothetical protein [Deltaproteobacteria bacterium]
MLRIPAILLALVLLPAPLAAAPAARASLADPGWPLPEDPALKGVRLDHPRGGPAASALHRLASCVGSEDESAGCVERFFPGADLKVRVLARTTAESAAGERPGLVRRAVEALTALPVEQVRGNQVPAMRECELVMEAALRGRCDDQGPVKGLAGVREVLDEETRSLLSPFLERLPAPGRRTIHRVVCGPIALGGDLRLDEALVVLGAGAPRAVEDLRCRMVPRPGPDQTAGAQVWAQARRQTEAVRALVLGLDCLDEGGGACQARVAPLTFSQLEALNRGLDEASEAKRAIWLEGMRERILGHPGQRRSWILSLAYDACPSLASIPEDRSCVAGPSRGARPPPLPRGLKGGEAAQARALRAILESSLKGLEPRQAEVQCGEVRAQVTYAAPEEGLPVLLGMRCGMPE